MREYQICKACVLDTSDPEIIFDNEGVCNYCHSYAAVTRSLPATDEAKQVELQRRVSIIKADGKNKKYDCIIGLSGGVDSTYLAWIVKESGLRPMAVHVDAGWNSEIAVGNIERLVRILGIDLFTVVINWEEMKDLQRSFLLARLPNCDIPQDHTFIASLYHTAHKHGIRHMISGHNIVTEFILPPAWGYDSRDLSHILDVHHQFGRIPLRTYPTLGLFKRIIYSRFIRPVKTHRFLYYIPYQKSSAKQFITDKLGWRDYGGKHCESLFTRFFQSYYLPVKFGFDKRRAHLSNLIVSNQISRIEALAELNKQSYNPDTISQETEYFCRKLEITPQEWKHIMEEPRGWHHDYKTDAHIWWWRLLKFAMKRK
jgi:aminotransferase